MGRRNEIEKLQKQNLRVFMRHGPGLRTSYLRWVVARDRKRGRVLVGGLGGCGVGVMWVDEEPRHKGYPGYKGAPEGNSWMGFGAPELRENCVRRVTPPTKGRKPPKGRKR